jgi:serine phosphatase RsbU (regulator of sigma subunit)
VTETRLRLCAGETLVCFTDGVTERRFGDTFFGEDGLVRTVSATDGDAQAVAAAVEAAVLAFAEHPPDDDLAVLVLRSVAPSEAPM